MNLLDNISGLSNNKVGTAVGGLNTAKNIFDSFFASKSSFKSQASSITSLKQSLRESSRQNRYSAIIISASNRIYEQNNIINITLPGVQISKMTYMDQGREFHFAGSSQTMNTVEVTFRTADMKDYTDIREWLNLANNGISARRAKNGIYKTYMFLTPTYINNDDDKDDKVISVVQLNGLFPMAVGDITYDSTVNDFATFTVSFSVDDMKILSLEKMGDKVEIEPLTKEFGFSDIRDMVSTGKGFISDVGQGIQTLKGFL
jgi:hypothetical protein